MNFVLLGRLGRLSLLALTLVLHVHTATYAADLLDDSSYQQEGEHAINDPIEPVNRVVFQFNDVVYTWVFNPVATGYSQVMPEDLRGAIGHFFYNLGEPVRAANCLLQGRFGESGLALSRFLINSTAGVFGLADPAANEFHIGPVRATLGQTFALWGLGDGLYLVVPFMGPSTLRDLTGSVLDSLAKSTYSPWGDDVWLGASAYALATVNDLSFHLGQYEEMKSLSLDPYSAFRDGYFQLRRKALQNPTPFE